MNTTYDLSQIQYFDPWGEVDIFQKNLPHWRQMGVPYFCTFRLGDSLPSHKLWMLKLLSENLRNVDDGAAAEEAHRLYLQRLDKYLDAGSGSCLLRHEAAALVVEGSLLHFDQRRYDLLSWSIMPNHVHVLLIPYPDWELDKILIACKKHTARQIGKLFPVTVPLWQRETYDRIVRNQKELCGFARYIYYKSAPPFCLVISD